MEQTIEPTVHTAVLTQGGAYRAALEDAVRIAVAAFNADASRPVLRHRSHERQVVVEIDHSSLPGEWACLVRDESLDALGVVVTWRVRDSAGARFFSFDLENGDLRVNCDGFRRPPTDFAQWMLQGWLARVREEMR